MRDLGSRRGLRVFLLAVLALTAGGVRDARAADQWPKEKAEAWAKEKGWLVGCNFIPSTAVNQLEMWQSETFDPATIDRELGWAESLGFNSVRVFLHDLPFRDDREGFLRRIDTFLSLAEKHHVGVMFVLFDSVWNPFPKSGPQPEPKAHLHNAGWVQGPGVAVLKDPSQWGRLEDYVKTVVGRYKNDPRVHLWDLINEPDNRNGSSYGGFEPENKAELALALLRKTFAWAREAGASQPLSSGVWIGSFAPGKASATSRYQIEASDVITFHSYDPLPVLKGRVKELRGYGRPLLCTEYMARPNGSRFDPVLGYFKDEGIAAYNWGFVAGKTQTIYPWDSWKTTYTAEPKIWFHDIFRKDGSIYDEAEVAYIRKVTGVKKP
ncbi:MAG: 1,4-beta-xylanase [Isosphaeraceae bacterium]